jgi:hypothetical protein
LKKCAKKGLKNWNNGAQTHTHKNLPPPRPKSFPPKKESSKPLQDKIYKHIDIIPLELKGKCGRET